jgi:hypothetical protein
VSPAVEVCVSVSREGGKERKDQGGRPVGRGV